MWATGDDAAFVWDGSVVLVPVLVGTGGVLGSGDSGRGARFLPVAAGDGQADNYAVEVQTDPGGEHLLVHLRLVHRHGIPLIENLDLEQLADLGATTFLFVLAPIALQGSTAAPANPLAVL